MSSLLDMCDSPYIAVDQLLWHVPSWSIIDRSLILLKFSDLSNSGPKAGSRSLGVVLHQGHAPAAEFPEPVLGRGFKWTRWQL